MKWNPYSLIYLSVSSTKLLVDYCICHSVWYVSFLWVNFCMLSNGGNDDVIIDAAEVIVLLVNSVVNWM